MMADASSRRGKRRKPAAAPVAANNQCNSSEIVPSSSLLLQIPADTNTSLPVWDAMRSQQADVTWAVSPYSVSVHLTPVTNKGDNQPSTSGISCSVLIQHHLVPQNTSSVLLTLFRNTQSPLCSSCQKCPPSSHQPDPQPSTSTGKEVPERKLQAQSEAPAVSSFFTKSTTDVLICDDFLLGLCHNGVNCTMHHSPYPFHWQLWSTSAHQWIDLAPRSQVLLERIYCDADCNIAKLSDGGVCIVLDFDTMELHDFSKYDGVRRLTNSDCTNKNPHFPSKWKLYWHDDDKFQEYTTGLSAFLIKKMKEKVITCTFQIATKLYEMDFLSMTQTNVTTGYQRKVRYRPVYRSSQSMQPYLRTGILSDLNPPDLDLPGTNFSVDPLVEFTSWYPVVWSWASVQDYSILDVPVGTLVYQTVGSLFHESMPESMNDIVSIQQIQNRFQWDKYQRQKTHMQTLHTMSQGPLERHLFHGTKANASEGICRNNFDPRLAGVNGNSHGYGSYFATKALISDAYTGQRGSDQDRYMFLAKVLVGRVIVGKHHYRRPPALNPKTQPHTLFDACVDNKEKPTMFIVYDSCQCYPYYLIKYRTLPTQIPISE